MKACLECGSRLSAAFHAVRQSEPTALSCMGEGGELPAPEGRSRRDADFCSRDCRNAFNNRRLARGAELYDLFMVARFDRPLAARLKIWGWLARLATSFRDDDNRSRAGRPSWRQPTEIIARKPWIAGRVLDRGRAA